MDNESNAYTIASIISNKSKIKTDETKRSWLWVNEMEIEIHTQFHAIAER